MQESEWKVKLQLSCIMAWLKYIVNGLLLNAFLLFLTTCLIHPLSNTQTHFSFFFYVLMCFFVPCLFSLGQSLYIYFLHPCAFLACFLFSFRQIENQLSYHLNYSWLLLHKVLTWHKSNPSWVHSPWWISEAFGETKSHVQLYIVKKQQGKQQHSPN